MDKPRRFLGDLSARAFLNQYWQKEPLLVRGALPNYTPPIDANELAGLACEPEVESRVVVFDGTTWQLENGPFEAETFPTRGERHWTLLVQDLDEHIPELGQLLSHLDFLPAWRVDDIMASFAAIGGSVGPHYDEYDVFLLQVEGNRRWQISNKFEPEALRTDSELRLLSHFEPEQEWVLQPGDMLYLPPHVAHYGVAETACMTFSLGCRAPSRTDLVAQMAGLLLSQLDERQRYRDADLRQDEAAEGLSLNACRRTTELLHEAWELSPALVARCLGAVATTPKLLFRNDEEELDAEQTERVLASTGGLYRRKGSRWTWYAQSPPLLFVNGREYPHAGTDELLRQLCVQRHFTPAWLNVLDSTSATLVQKLVADGQLVAED